VAVSPHAQQQRITELEGALEALAAAGKKVHGMLLSERSTDAKTLRVLLEHAERVLAR
jgi:hypothetical protein